MINILELLDHELCSFKNLSFVCAANDPHHKL